MKMRFTLLVLGLTMVGQVTGGSTPRQAPTLQNVKQTPQTSKKKKKKTSKAAYAPNTVGGQGTEKSPNDPNNGTTITPGGNDNKIQTQVQPDNGNTGIVPNNGGNGQTISDKDIQKQVTPIVEKKDNGAINWTEQYIEATGATAIDTARFKIKAQAKLMAARGAVVVAQRNLLEIVKGVNVTGETTVKDMVATSDYVYSRVEGVVKGAQQIGEPVEQDGMVTVRLRMPIYASNGLAPAVVDNQKTAVNTDPLKATDPNKGTSGQTTAQTGTNTANNGALPHNAADLINDGEKILFNLGGKKFNPSMFPVITDEKGNVLLDMKKIYDPNTGQFPKIVQASKDMLAALGNKKGVQIVDAVQNQMSTGKIVLTSASKSKINWSKIGSTAAQIGKILLMFI